MSAAYPVRAQGFDFIVDANGVYIASSGPSYRGEIMHKLNSHAALVAALSDLVHYYVANMGGNGASEFISCVTPRGASSMTKAQRKADPCWSKWDKARAALALAKGGAQ